MTVTTRRLFVVVAAVVAAASAGGCAAVAPPGPAAGPAGAEAPGLRDLAFPPEAADVAVTVFPTPYRVVYSGTFFPLDGAEFVDELHPDVAKVAAEAGLDAAWADLPAEGYVLRTTVRDGRTVVLAAAKDEPGRRWAAVAVSQLTVNHAGRPWIREAKILDAPAFPLRGNKRPEPWERRYRANFAWEVKDVPEFAERESVATWAPGSPLDATPAAVGRILAAWRPWQERGVRRFCLKFDDVGFGLTPETESRTGDYAGALRTLMAALRGGLRERDPRAVLYLLPQTYWWNDPRLGEYARALRAAGGLDPDVGLVVTGPEIISPTIDAPGLAGVRDRFGSLDTPALVYDNLGREGDWGPLTGRDPDLVTLCDAVFGERGTPVHRLTRLDWAWNPRAYDPERSWRRAILELAGPEGFGALFAACDAYRRKASRTETAAAIRAFAALPDPPEPGPLPRMRIANLLLADMRTVRPHESDAPATLRLRPVREPREIVPAHRPRPHEAVRPPAADFARTGRR